MKKFTFSSSPFAFCSFLLFFLFLASPNTGYGTTYTRKLALSGETNGSLTLNQCDKYQQKVTITDNNGASTNNGGGYTYTSSDQNIITLAGPATSAQTTTFTITGTGTGTATYTVELAEGNSSNKTYSAATTSQTVTVKPLSISTVTWSNTSFTATFDNTFPSYAASYNGGVGLTSGGNGIFAYRVSESSGNYNTASIIGDAGTAYTVTGLTPGTTYEYYLQNGNTTCRTSGTVTTTCPTVSVSNIEAPAAIYAGSTVSVPSVPTVNLGYSGHYSGEASGWQLSNDNFSTPVPITTALTGTGWKLRYYAKSVCSEEKYSNTVDVTVYTIAAGAISGSSSLCAGSNYSIGAGTAATVSPTATIEYRWLYKLNGGTETVVPSSNSAGLTQATFNPLDGGTYTLYREARVGALAWQRASGSYTLTVTEGEYGSITGNTAAQDICIGSDIHVVGDAASGQYKWRYSTDGSTYQDLTGCTSQNLDINLANAGMHGNTYFFRRQVSPGGGCGYNYSDGTYSVSAKEINAGKINTTTSQLCLSNTATISSNTAATTTPTSTSGISYRWEYKLNGSSTAVTISGATRADLTFTPTEAGNYEIRRYAYYTTGTRSGGNCAEVQSEGTHTLVVTSVSSYGTITSGSTCDGTVSVESTALPVFVPTTAPVSYRWQYTFNGGTAQTVSGATGATLSAAVPTAAGTYRYTRTAMVGGCTVASAGTYTAYKMDAGSIDGSTTASYTTAINISGTAANDGANTVGANDYQWYRNGSLTAVTTQNYSGTETVPGTYTYTRKAKNHCGTYENTANTYTYTLLDYTVFDDSTTTRCYFPSQTVNVGYNPSADWATVSDNNVTLPNGYQTNDGFLGVARWHDYNGKTITFTISSYAYDNLKLTFTSRQQAAGYSFSTIDISATGASVSPASINSSTSEKAHTVTITPTGSGDITVTFTFSGGNGFGDITGYGVRSLYLTNIGFTREVPAFGLTASADPLLCGEGSSITLTAHDADLYTWFTPSSTATGSTVTASETGTYVVRGTDASGNNACEAGIEVVRIVTARTTAPTATQTTLCPGGSSVISLNDAGMFGNVAPTQYIWQTSNDNSSWTDAASNSNYANYTYTASAVGTKYLRMKFRYNDSDDCLSYSPSCLVRTVSQPVVATPTVTPDRGCISTLSTVVLAASATADAAISLSYRWQYSSNNSTFGDLGSEADYVGGTGTSLQAGSFRSGTRYAYRLQAYNSTSGCTAVGSSIDLGTVTPLNAGSIATGAAAFCLGDNTNPLNVANATAASVSSGDAITYRWAYYAAGSSTEHIIANQNGASLSSFNTGNIATGGNYFVKRYACTACDTAVATTEYGITIIDASAIHPAAPTLSAAQLCTGGSITLTPQSIDAMTGVLVSYQWQRKVGAGGSYANFGTAVNSLSALDTVVSGAGVHYYRMQYGYMDNRCTSTGAEASITVIADPTVGIGDPSSATACPNSTITIVRQDAVGGMGSYTYEWQYQADGSSTWQSLGGEAVYAGADGSTLSISNFNTGNQENDQLAFRYRVNIPDNEYGCNVGSAVKETKVSAYPVPIAHDTTVCPGITNTVNYSATTTSNAYNIRWYDGNTLLSGTPGIIPADNSMGTYTRYASQYKTAGGCESGKQAVKITIDYSSHIAHNSSSGNAEQHICFGDGITTQYITPIEYGYDGDAIPAITWAPRQPAGISGVEDADAHTYTLSGAPAVTGTYTYELRLSGGLCADPQVLTGSITIDTAYLTHEYISLCEGESYQRAAGFAVHSAAGTYYDTCHTATGCDSVIAVHLSSGGFGIFGYEATTTLAGWSSFSNVASPIAAECGTFNSTSTITHSDWGSSIVTGGNLSGTAVCNNTGNSLKLMNQLNIELNNGKSIVIKTSTKGYGSIELNYDYKGSTRTNLIGTYNSFNKIKYEYKIGNGDYTTVSNEQAVTSTSDAHVSVDVSNWNNSLNDRDTIYIRLTFNDANGVLYDLPFLMDNIAITGQKAIPLTITADDETVCSNVGVVLTAPAAVATTLNYQWTRKAGGTATVLDQHGNIISDYPEANAEYVVAVGNEQCLQKDSITIAVTPVTPHSDIVVYDTICANALTADYRYRGGNGRITYPALSVLKQGGAHNNCLLSYSNNNPEICDSVIYLNLYTYPQYSYTIYDDICDGSTYNKNGFTVTPAQYRTVTIGEERYETVKNTVSQHGCDSIIHLSLNINQLNYTLQEHTDIMLANWYFNEGANDLYPETGKRRETASLQVSKSDGTILPVYDYERSASPLDMSIKIPTGYGECVRTIWGLSDPAESSWKTYSGSYIELAVSAVDYENLKIRYQTHKNDNNSYTGVECRYRFDNESEYQNLGQQNIDGGWVDKYFDLSSVSTVGNSQKLHIRLVLTGGGHNSSTGCGVLNRRFEPSYLSVDNITIYGNVPITDTLKAPVASRSEICSQDSSIISIQGTFTFSLADTTAAHNSYRLSAKQFVVKPVYTTTYQVIATDADGCDSIQSITITTRPKPQIIITEGRKDTILCSGTALGNLRYHILNADSAFITMGTYNGIEQHLYESEGTGTHSGYIGLSGTPGFWGEAANYTITTTRQLSTCQPTTLYGSITARELPHIALQKGSAYNCIGDTLKFALSNDAGFIFGSTAIGDRYRWYTDAGQTVVVSDTNHYAVTAASYGDTLYSVTVTQDHCTADTYYKVYIYDNVEAGVIAQGSQTMCVGGVAQRIAETTAPSMPNGVINGSYHYQWYRKVGSGDYAAIAGTADSVSYTPSETATGTYSYRREVSDNCYNWQQSANEWQLTVVELPVINNIAITYDSICVGGGNTVTATSTQDAAAGAVHYQWQQALDGGAWTDAGNDENTLSYANAAAGKHSSRVTVSQAGSGCTATSAATAFEVMQQPAVTIMPNNDTAICKNTDIVLHAATVGGTHQQYCWTIGGSTTCAGTQSVYSNDTLTVTTVFGVEIPAITERNCQAAGDQQTVTVYADVDAGSLTMDPVTQYIAVCKGGTPAIGTAVVPQYGDIHYRWIAYDENADVYDTLYPASAALPAYSEFTHLTIDDDFINDIHYLSIKREVWDQCHNIMATEIINWDEILEDFGTLYIIGDPTLTIATALTDSICVGGSTALSYEITQADGDNYSPQHYQWQTSTDNAQWDDLDYSAAGYTYTHTGTDTLTLNIVSNTPGKRYYRLTCNYGIGCDAVSAVDSFVTVPDPTWTTATVTPANICPGSLFTFNAEVNSVLGGTIQWTEDGAVIDPATVPASGAHTYAAQYITDREGCNLSNSTAVNVIVYNTVVAGSIPAQAEVICFGGAPTTINAEVPANSNISGSLQYRWLCDNGSREDTITSGATYNYTPTQTAIGHYSYRREVSDACGQWQTSGNSATLTIVGDPTVVITYPTADSSICKSEGVTLTANVTGGLDVTYQWTLSGDVCNSCTSDQATYTFPSLKESTTFTITIPAVAAKGCDMATASRAITVYDEVTAGSIATAGQRACMGGTWNEITENTAAAAGNGSLQYQWYVKGPGVTDSVSIAAATASTYTPTTALFATTGDYTFIRNVKDACDDWFTSEGRWTVTIVADPTWNATTLSPRDTICINESITLATTVSNGEGNQITWYRLKEGAETEDVVTASTNVPAAGYHRYYPKYTTMTANAGCQLENGDTLSVKVYDMSAVLPQVTSMTYCHDERSASFTAAATDEHFVLQWYSAASGGTASTETPAVMLNTTTGATSHTYYVSQKVNIIACESPRTGVTINVRQQIPSPTVDTNSYCSLAGAEENYSAAVTDPSSYKLYWFDGTASTETTPKQSLNVAGQYSHSVFQQTNDAPYCTSDTVKALIKVVASPAVPAVSDGYVMTCQNGGGVDIAQYASAATGCSLLWYNKNDALITGPVYSTSNIDTISFFVRNQMNDAPNCMSDTNRITVEIYMPVLPGIVGDTLVGLCDDGMIMYHVLNPVEDFTYQWNVFEDNAIDHQDNDTVYVNFNQHSGYVEVNSVDLGGCLSERSRNNVTLVNCNVTANFGISSQTICAGMPLTVTDASTLMNRTQVDLDFGDAAVAPVSFMIYDTAGYTPFSYDISYPGGGTKTITLTLTKGSLTSVQQYDVTVHGLPATPVAVMPGQRACHQAGFIDFNNSVEENDDAATHYYWRDHAEDLSGVYNADVISTAEVGTFSQYVTRRMNSFPNCESAPLTVLVEVTALPEKPETLLGKACLNTGNVGYRVIEAGTGYHFQWYAADRLTPAGDSLQSTEENGTFIKYVSRVMTEAPYCESALTADTVIVMYKPEAPTVTDQTVCQYSIPVSYQADTYLPNLLVWYEDAVTTQFVTTAPAAPSTDTAGVHTYYVASEINTGFNCLSERVPVSITIQAAPAAPTAINKDECKNNHFAYFETIYNDNYQLGWYTAPSSTVRSLVNPSVSTDVPGDYYAYAAHRSTDFLQCESQRTAVKITVHNVPSASVISGPVTMQNCAQDNGSYSIANPVNTMNYTWAVSPEEHTFVGSNIGTGVTVHFTTANALLTVTTTNEYSCSTDTSINITLNNCNIFNTQFDFIEDTLCAGSEAAIVDFSSGINNGAKIVIDWGTGTDSLVIASVNESNYPLVNVRHQYTEGGRYNVKMKVMQGGQTSIATKRLLVIAPPAALSAYYEERCATENEFVQFNLTPDDGCELEWYKNSLRVNPSAMLELTTNNSTEENLVYSFYVGQHSSVLPTCKSDSVSAVIKVLPLVASPTVTEQNFCYSGTESASYIAAATEGNKLVWYANAIDNDTLHAPVCRLNSVGSNTVYVSQRQINAPYCESYRVSNAINVYQQLALPVTDHHFACQDNDGTTTFEARPSNGHYQLVWYADASLRTPLTESPSRSTATAGNYAAWVAQKTYDNDICISDTVRAILTVLDAIATPSVTKQHVCQNAEDVTFNITLNEPLAATDDYQYYWYYQSEGGNGITPAPACITGQPNTMVMYVTKRLRGEPSCESQRAADTIVVEAVPQIPFIAGELNVSSCNPEKYEYHVINGSSADHDYEWTITPEQSHHAGLSSDTTYIEFDDPTAAIVVKAVDRETHCSTTASPVLIANTACNMIANFTVDNDSICGTGTNIAITPVLTGIMDNTIVHFDFGAGAVPSEYTAVYPNIDDIAVKYDTYGMKNIRLTLTRGDYTTYTDKNLWIMTPPNAPVVSNNYACLNSGNVSFGMNVTPSLVTDYYWYESNDSLAARYVTAPAITTVTSGTHTYYVSQRYKLAPYCESGRTATTITVVAQPEAPAVVQPQTACLNSGTFYFDVAATAASAHTLHWYNAATGGEESASVPSVTTGTAGIYTKYVSQSSDTHPACESQRAAVSVQVPDISTPIISGPLTPACSATGVVYSISNVPTGATYQWTVPEGASITSTGSSSITVNYGQYNGVLTAEATVAGCTSSAGSLDIYLDGCDIAAYFTLSEDSVCGDGSLLFHDFSSGLSVGDSLYIDFGDGAQPANKEVKIDNNYQRDDISIYYTSAGKKTITLTLFDASNSNAAHIYKDSVKVNEIPTLAISGIPTGALCPNAGSLSLSVSITGQMSACHWEGSGINAGNAGTNPAAIVINPAQCNNTYNITAFATSALSGCTGTHTEVYTVKDTMKPAITCSFTSKPANNPAACQFTVPDLVSMLTISDNCSSPTTVQSPSANTIITANTVVTITAEDACGNDSTIQITVEVPVMKEIQLAAFDNGVLTGSICKGALLTVKDTAAHDNYTYLWSQTDSTGNNIQVTASRGITSYSATATNQYGCQSSKSITVIIDTLPTVSISMPALACSGNSHTLTANTTAERYAWSTGETTSSVATATDGDYTVTVTDQHGCSMSATAALVVYSSPTITLTAAKDTVCAFTADTLTATAQLNGATLAGYRWSMFEGLTNASSMRVIVDTNTNYTVTISTTDGCTATADKSIRVRALPNVAIVPSKDTLCLGESTTLTATGALTYRWTNGATTSSIAVQPTTYRNYSVTGTDLHGCTNSSTAQIEVTPLPNTVLNVYPALSLCEDATLTLNVGTLSNCRYQWMKDNADIAGKTSPLYRSETPESGRYSVIINDSITGCTLRLDTTITVNSLPTVSVDNIIGTNPVCQSATEVYHTDLDGSYLWSVEGGIILNAYNNRDSIKVKWNAAPGATHSVTLTLTDDHLCHKSATRSILMNSLPNTAISGTLEICHNDTVVYQSNALPHNNYQYLWYVEDGDIIGSESDSAIMVVWNGEIDGTLQLTVTDLSTACAASQIHHTIIHSLPTPIIFGNQEVCTDSNVIQYYTTQEEMTQYSWSVSDNGIIVSGGDAATVGVKWLQEGTGVLNIIYADNHCEGSNLNDYHVTVHKTPSIIPMSGNYDNQEVCALLDIEPIEWQVDGYYDSLTIHWTGLQPTDMTLTRDGVRHTLTGTTSVMGDYPYYVCTHSYCEPDTMFGMIRFTRNTESDRIICKDNFVHILSYGIGDTTLYSLGEVPTMEQLNGEPVEEGDIVSVINNAVLPMTIAAEDSVVVQWIIEDHCGYKDTCHQTFTIHYPPCGGDFNAVDRESNQYNTVRIIHNCWLQENLKSTRYSDDAPVAVALAYYAQAYPNTAENVSVYGRLYSWYSAVKVPEGSTVLPDTNVYGHVEGVCPEGWYLPTNDNFIELMAYGADQLRSDTLWIENNRETLTPLLEVLPAGYFDHTVNNFYNLHGEAFFWTSDVVNEHYAKQCGINFSCEELNFSHSSKGFGYSVRCIKE